MLEGVGPMNLARYKHTGLEVPLCRIEKSSVHIINQAILGVDC